MISAVMVLSFVCGAQMDEIENRGIVWWISVSDVKLGVEAKSGNTISHFPACQLNSFSTHEHLYACCTEHNQSTCLPSSVVSTFCHLFHFSARETTMSHSCTGLLWNKSSPFDGFEMHIDITGWRMTSSTENKPLIDALRHDAINPDLQHNQVYSNSTSQYNKHKDQQADWRVTHSTHRWGWNKNSCSVTNLKPSEE